MNDPNFAIEIQYSRGHVAYLVAMNTSAWTQHKKIKYRVTQPPLPYGSKIPAGALRVTNARAKELAGILNECGRIAVVVTAAEQHTKEYATANKEGE